MPAQVDGSAKGADEAPDDSTLPKAKRARTQKAFGGGDSDVAAAPTPQTPAHPARRSRLGHEADTTTYTPLSKVRARTKRSPAPTPVRPAETIGEAFATR